MTDDVDKLTDEAIAHQKTVAFMAAKNAIEDMLDLMESDGQIITLLVCFEELATEQLNEFHLSGQVDLEFIEDVRQDVFEVVSRLSETEEHEEAPKKPSHLRVVH